MRRHVAIALLLVLVAACAAPPRAPLSPAEALIRLPASSYPDFTDTSDMPTLAESVARSVEYFGKLPPDREVAFGAETYTAGGMAHSLGALHAFILSGPGPEGLRQYITENFDVYVSAGSDGFGTLLYTGYYTPSLMASDTSDDTYAHPLYGVPDDLVTAELGLFRAKYEGDIVRGAVRDRRLVPYYSRAEIDGAGALSGRGLEIAWCTDPIDVFFLHVQGSGVLAYPDGGIKNVNYAGANGREYRSVGRLLIQQGKAALPEMSMQFIRGYLTEHPDELRGVLDYNESYVFFKLEDDGPYGSLGVPVTPGRSIATDKKFYPEGALCFVATEVPEFNEQGDVTGLVPYSRFAMNQDTGGAIKGAGRADIYFGHDEVAEITAGHMRGFGRLYFLAGKRQGR